jgi:hypothetical protein
MTSQADQSTDRETCRKLISLGYSRSNHVHLYGQKVELVSDPYSDKEGDIAVEVKKSAESASQTMKLPLSVVQVARTQPEKRSA